VAGARLPSGLVELHNHTDATYPIYWTKTVARASIWGYRVTVVGRVARPSSAAQAYVRAGNRLLSTACRPYCGGHNVRVLSASSLATVAVPIYVLLCAGSGD